MKDKVDEISKTQELKKLYDLLEKVSHAILGSDFQTRMLMRRIKTEVIERIKKIESELRQMKKKW